MSIRQKPKFSNRSIIVIGIMSSTSVTDGVVKSKRPTRCGYRSMPVNSRSLRRRSCWMGRRTANFEELSNVAGMPPVPVHE